MPTQTINYGLLKDNENEFYNVQRVNENLDKIDQALGDKAGKSKIFTVMLASAGWVGTVAPFTQTVALAGIKATDEPDGYVVVTSETDDTEITEYSKITKMTTGNDVIIAVCYKKKPTVALTIILKVVG